MPDSTTDGTIHLLADEYDLSVDAPGKALLSRDNNGNWNFSSIALLAGTTISQWASINSSGVIAAIGTTSSDPAHQHALLLVPLPVVLTTQYADAGWHDDLHNSTIPYSYMRSPTVTVTAIVNKFLGSLIQGLKVYQDINGKLTVSYVDTTSTSCALTIASNAGGFMADDDTRYSAKPAPPDSQGNVTYTFFDHPTLAFNDAARFNLSDGQYNGMIRDFVVVTINGKEQIVAEMDWSFTIGQNFNSGDMSFPTATTPGTTALFSTTPPTTPQNGSTISGGIPANKRVSYPRTPTANSFYSDTKHWTPSSSSRTADSFKYQNPASPTTQ